MCKRSTKGCKNDTKKWSTICRRIGEQSAQLADTIQVTVSYRTGRKHKQKQDEGFGKIVEWEPESNRSECRSVQDKLTLHPPVNQEFHERLVECKGTGQSPNIATVRKLGVLV